MAAGGVCMPHIAPVCTHIRDFTVKPASAVASFNLGAGERPFFTLLKHVPPAGLSVEGEEVHTRWMWLELGINCHGQSRHSSKEQWQRS